MSLFYNEKICPSCGLHRGICKCFEVKAYSTDTSTRRNPVDMLPSHMREGMTSYIQSGLEPGGFLTAVLSNDLYLACSQADHINKYVIPDYIEYLVNYAPLDCWGSEKQVRAWIEHRGLKGLRQKEQNNDSGTSKNKDPY